MPPFGPVDRKDLIRHLRKIGFQGPFSGGRHAFMVRNDIVLHIPNPHRGAIGKELLIRLLRQGKISRQEWEQL
ncbi:MAG: type II toxin-antitoxin system HicA family toxin [Magnetococcales bacterium]|nr:type II toxin-antitoxin system HicA family toxin [Magnetococcales bacterium]